MRSRDSKGRAYLDNEPEYRTAFHRERDRMLHTTAFRRLEAAAARRLSDYPRTIAEAGNKPIAEKIPN